MGKRLFIAVDVDERTRAQVAAISLAARTVVDSQVKASWVRAERMHMTLHFFGHAEAAVEHRILDVLAQPIPEAPFDLVFKGLGFFPERGSPRVLWLGVERGERALKNLQQRLTRELRLPAEDTRPFAPHLTLARFKERVSRAKIGDLRRIPAAAGPSRIDRVTLYESRLSPLDLGSGRPEAARRAGSIYHPLGEALLQP